MFSGRATKPAPRQLTIADLPCVHRGEPLGERDCDTCGHKGTTVMVYSCAVYGECTIHRRLKTRRVAVCNGCDERA